MPARLLERSEHVVDGRRPPGAGRHCGAGRCGTAERRRLLLVARQSAGTSSGRSSSHRWSEGNPELRTIAPVAWIGLAIVGLVLLIACFNVAALLLARAADRQREIGVRTALGASRARIVRQFAVEGLMLALVSGAAAVVVAGWSADLLSAFSLPSPIPQRLHIGVDRRLIAFHGAARRVRRRRAVAPAGAAGDTRSTSWRRCEWRARSGRGGPGCATSSWSRRLPARRSS